MGRKRDEERNAREQRKMDREKSKPDLVGSRSSESNAAHDHLSLPADEKIATPPHG